MSFFKKLKEEFGGSSSEQSYPAQGQGYQQQQQHQYPPQDQYNRPQAPSQHSSYGQPQQPQYGGHQQPPPVPYGSRDAYGQPPQHQPSYNSQPPYGSGSPAPGYGGSPAPGYGGSPAPGYGPRPGDNNYQNNAPSPAPYGADPNRPPVPGQWVPLFSEQHQRWYFVETTGRSLWDAPAYVAPQAPMPAYGDYAGSRGAEGGYAAGAPGGEYRGDQGGYGGGEQQKKDNDKRNMMLAAGGALAVGAIGGAVLAEALGAYLLFLLSNLLFTKLLWTVC